MQQEAVLPDSVTFVAVLNACTSIVAIGGAGMLMSRSFKVDGIQMPLWEVG
jgi:hypothetical protein